MSHLARWALHAVLAAALFLGGPSAATGEHAYNGHQSTSAPVVEGPRDAPRDQTVHAARAAIGFAHDGYDNYSKVARTLAPLAEYRLAPQTVVRAESAADAARLARQLQLEEAASVFTRSGGLHPSVIQGSRPILQGSQLRNPQVIKALTADGSNIADWAKYSTQGFQSPSGPFQVHFYRNQFTGATNYSIDYKVVFGGSP